MPWYGCVSLFQRHHFHSLAVHGDCAVWYPGGHRGHGHLHRPVALGEAGHHRLVHAHGDLDQPWGDKGDTVGGVGPGLPGAGWQGNRLQFFRGSLRPQVIAYPLSRRKHSPFLVPFYFFKIESQERKVRRNCGNVPWSRASPACGGREDPATSTFRRRAQQVWITPSPKPVPPSLRLPSSSSRKGRPEF